LPDATLAFQQIVFSCLFVHPLASCSPHLQLLPSLSLAFSPSDYPANVTGGKARGLSNDKPLWHLAGSWLEVGLAYSFQGSIPGTNIFLNIAFLVLSNVTADSIHLFMC
jgi:hypothetical protein